MRREALILILALAVFSVLLASGCVSPFETCEQKNERCKTDCESRDNILQVAACKLDCERLYAECHDQGF